MQMRHVHADAFFFYHQFSSAFDYWTICCEKKIDCNFTHSKISCIL